MKKMTLCLSTAFTVVVFLLSGCVDGTDDTIDLPFTDPYHLKIAEGWVEFESGRYNDAIAVFSEASEVDSLRSNAYLGLGWCYAMIDDLDRSLSNLVTATQKEPGAPDGHAAKVFVYLAQEQYDDVIAAGNRAISLGGDEYVFSQIPDVHTRNIRLAMAEAYYAEGQYADAQTQIDILEPNNRLDQNSQTYERDLILEIESLRSVSPVLEELMSN